MNRLNKNPSTAWTTTEIIPRSLAVDNNKNNYSSNS